MKMRKKELYLGNFEIVIFVMEKQLNCSIFKNI